MQIPPYFPQENKYTCSLAVLRMALSYFDISITEKILVNKAEKDYGENFKNIWNPTIAKLACEYGLSVKMYALWPLFKKENLNQALIEYKKNPSTMHIVKYENKNDTDQSTEPLPLAYREMFEAVKKGCTVYYGSLTKKRLETFLKNGSLVQTSIRLHKLYPGKKNVYHSILVFGLQKDIVLFHDPSYGENQKVSVTRLLAAALNVGAFMVYNNRR